MMKLDMAVLPARSGETLPPRPILSSVRASAATPGCKTSCLSSSGQLPCHNGGYTVELHTTFVYRSTSDGFFCSSDDDLWV